MANAAIRKLPYARRRLGLSLEVLIALLAVLAVLNWLRRQVVQQPRGKDGTDPRMRIENGLTRPEGQRIPQSHNGNTPFSSQDQRQPRFIVLRERINAVELEGRLLLDGNTAGHGGALWAPHSGPRNAVPGKKARTLRIDTSLLRTRPVQKL